MAAVLELIKCTGANYATETLQTDNITRLLSADNATTTVGLHEIGKPITGTGYSYENVHRWKVQTAPANRIENVRVYGPNTDPATGHSLYIGTTATAASGGPVNTQSTIATTAIVGNHDSETNALAIGTPQTNDELVIVGDKTDYIVIQLRLTTSAASGNYEFTEWLLYDEV